MQVNVKIKLRVSSAVRGSVKIAGQPLLDLLVAFETVKIIFILRTVLGLQPLQLITQYANHHQFVTR